MRGAGFLLGLFVVGIASAAACAEGDTPGFQNVGGGGGASGDGGSGQGGGGDDDDDTSGSRSSTTSGQATGSSTVTSSVATSTSTSTTTTTTTTTSTGTGGAPPCQDTGLGEPSNDQMATAYNLGEQGDDDGDERTIAGVLQATDDVDWYFYMGVDNFGSSVDPGRQIVGAGIRICKYIDCIDEAPEEFECPSGTQPDTQGGHAGCCWTDNEPVEWGLNCDGPISDDARVYMRVDHVGGPGCESYSLKFNY